MQKRFEGLLSNWQLHACVRNMQALWPKTLDVKLRLLLLELCAPGDKDAAFVSIQVRREPSEAKKQPFPLVLTGFLALSMCLPSRASQTH